ncbi:HTH-type transcriptional regulator CymR [Pseudobythopirellula maris]|uniref:HTH-type transcriptional regulator CymR n=1 Tax=Pseudobythopirellula maris TaxID=2527991 RepID=A0A5C5ZNF5_9BACT|nr:Rrf2 family transcriptional regulator [Pseudobythopirellula maris]TWT88646.1 HTH-type transcriptional regulator CymR [Pseudobythopirellula maris]
MLSAKTEYACLALLQLAAEHGSARPAPLRRLAEEGRIPEGFLVQILQELKRLGFVVSTRGASGGYRLARDPAEITVGDVYEALQDQGDARSNLPEPTPLAEQLGSLCAEAQRAQRACLRGVTLAELAERCGSQAEAMWYI